MDHPDGALLYGPGLRGAGCGPLPVGPDERLEIPTVDDLPEVMDAPGDQAHAAKSWSVGQIPHGDQGENDGDGVLLNHAVDLGIPDVAPA